MKILIGNLGNTFAINFIILLPKEMIYSAMKKEKITHILNVKYLDFQKKYRHYVKGKKYFFDN